MIVKINVKIVAVWEVCDRRYHTILHIFDRVGGYYPKHIIFFVPFNLHDNTAGKAVIEA